MVLPEKFPEMREPIGDLIMREECRGERLSFYKHNIIFLTQKNFYKTFYFQVFEPQLFATYRNLNLKKKENSH